MRATFPHPTELDIQVLWYGYEMNLVWQVRESKSFHEPYFLKLCFKLGITFLLIFKNEPFFEVQF